MRRKIETLLGLLFFCGAVIYSFWRSNLLGGVVSAKGFVPFIIVVIAFGVYSAIKILEDFAEKAQSYLDSVMRIVGLVTFIWVYVIWVGMYAHDLDLELKSSLWIASFTALVLGELLGIGLYFGWPKTWWPRKRDRVSQYVEDPDNPPSWKGLAEGD